MKIFRAALLGSLLLAACSLFAQDTPAGVIITKTITSSGQTITFNNCVANTQGQLCVGRAGMTAMFDVQVLGSPSTVSVVTSGCGALGDCDVLDTYTSVANSNRKPVIGGPYSYFTVQAVWTGGTNVSVPVGATIFPNSPNSTFGGTVTVSGAVTQGSGAGSLTNGWWNKLTDGVNGPVAVKPASTGPSASDPSLVVTMSPNSPAPALPTGASTSANQVPPGTAGTPNAGVQSIQGITGMTPVKTDGSGVTQPVSMAANTPTQGNAGSNAQAWWVRIGDATNGPAAVKPASTAVGATDPSLAVGLSPNSPLPAGSNALGSVTVTTAPTTPVQPAGFAAEISGQQAVTGSAAALATNATQHWACVKATPANTISVFVGPSGITTATGYELGPGDERCYLVTNTNQLYVIASTTGASVSWTAQ